MQDYGISENFFKEIDASVKSIAAHKMMYKVTFHVSGIFQ